jgi:hypothetical protein
MTYYLGYEFTKAVVQTLGNPIQGDSATTLFTADAAHGRAVGDIIYVTALGGGSGAGLLTRYFVKTVPSPTTMTLSTTPGGSALALGTTTDMVIVPIIETRLYKAASIKPATENKTYTWEGDGEVEKLESLVGVSYDFSPDCVPTTAHAAIFGKTALTGDFPGGLTNAYGYGGGNDRSGVACGLRLEGNAIKDVDGVRSTVTFAMWLPVGTLNLKTPPGLQTGNKFEQMAYSFAAKKTKTDLGGAPLTGASTDGEFFIIGEI